MWKLFEIWKKSERVNPTFVEPNPYVPPIEDNSPAMPSMPVEEWESLDIRVAFVQRSSWRRSITLTGSLDANVLYDSAGLGERVYVNDRLVARTSLFVWSANVAPRVDFELECRGALIPARIDVDVRLSWAFMSIYKFCLTVAGKKIYEE